MSIDASPAVGEAPPKSIIATPAKIGFLGLGIMGSGMVTNLLKSGHEVTVWNRTASKVSSVCNHLHVSLLLCSLV